MKFLWIGLKKRISEEKTLKEIITIYFKIRMSDNLQVEILDFMIEEIDDTNDLLLERVKRLQKFQSKASNTAHNEADRSRFSETKISERITSFHYDTRLQMIIDEIESIREQIEENKKRRKEYQRLRKEEKKTRAISNHNIISL